MRALRGLLLPVGTAAAVMLLTGCGLARVVQPNPDNMAAWSDRPMAPDPNLTKLALDSPSSCAGDPNDGPIRVLLQDRRTPQTAAFLVTSLSRFGSCIVTSGGSSGGSGPLPGPMTGRLTIDANGFGTASDTEVRHLGGRVANTASQVVIKLADGRSVIASIGNGYWLAWWPNTTFAERVVASDATGAEIANVKVVE